MRKVVLFILFIVIAPFGELLAQSEKYGPKAKNRKPWKKEVVKPDSVQVTYSPKRNSLRSLEAKNYKIWKDSTRKVITIPVTTQTRKSEYGPKAKNRKAWEK